MSYINDLGNFMNFSVKQRDTISNNISNQTTPGYKAKTVVWNEELQKGLSLNTTNDKHIPIGGSDEGSRDYKIIEDRSLEVNSDGNSVDLNKEMIEMFKNNQQMSMSLKALNNLYETKSAAKGR